MVAKRKLYRLEELCDFINGFAFKSTDYVSASAETLEVFRMGYIGRGGGFKEDDSPVFVPMKYGKQLDRYFLRPGDIAIAMTDMKDRVAILGNTAWIRDAGRFVLNQRVGCIRVKRPDLLDPRFLYYYSNWHPYVERLRSRANSGVQVNLSTTTIKESELEIPSLSEQKAIAAVLSTLDDKIELNRRTNETLEGLAHSFFKSWFVDATQDGLPNGWREGKVDDLITVSRDSLNPSEFPDQTFDHYSIPAFDEGRTPKRETGASIKSNKFIVPSGSVLLSKLNPRIPRVWLADVLKQNRAICSTEFLVAIPKPGVPREFLFCLFKAESFVSVFATMVTGTSGSHQRVKPESLLAMEALIPPQPLSQRFTETVSPLLTRVSRNIHESQTLAALRDALLPKLLSGDLSIRVNGNNQTV